MASKTTFTCGEHLDITEAAGLYARLQKSLSKSSHIEIKADAVSKADTAGLQLFVALAREVANTGGGLTWKKPSQTLIDTAKLLGLDRELGLH